MLIQKASLSVRDEVGKWKWKGRKGEEEVGKEFWEGFDRFNQFDARLWSISHVSQAYIFDLVCKGDILI